MIPKIVLAFNARTSEY